MYFLTVKIFFISKVVIKYLIAKYNLLHINNINLYKTNNKGEILVSSKKSNLGNKGRKYQNKVIRNLSILLMINSLVYLIFSPRLIDLNIDIITEITTEIRNIVGFNYNVNTYTLINFLLIALAVVKILFVGRKLPVMLILVLLFIIKFDDALVLKLGESAIFVRSMLDTYTSNLGIIEDLVKFKYNIEYLNYLVTICMPIYLLLKKVAYNVFDGIKKITDNTKKKSNSTSKNTTRQNNMTFSNSGRCKTDNTHSNDDDDNDNYYGNPYYSNNYNHLDRRGYNYNNPYGKKGKFRITSDYDKERAYEMSMTDPYRKVVNESGIEMYAWEYGNIYEEEKRQEEFNFQQEQFSYSSNNNSYPIYNSCNNDDLNDSNYYDNNDSYSSSYDNSGSYGSSYDDYYESSYSSYDNDDWY